MNSWTASRPGTWDNAGESGRPVFLPPFALREADLSAPGKTAANHSPSTGQKKNDEPRPGGLVFIVPWKVLKGHGAFPARRLHCPGGIFRMIGFTLSSCLICSTCVLAVPMLSTGLSVTT